MGATAVRHTAKVLDHVEMIVAIELLAAAQGVDFRRQVLGQGVQMGRGTAVVYALIREQVPFLEEDVPLYPYMEAVRQLVADGTLKEAVEEVLSDEG